MLSIFVFGQCFRSKYCSFVNDVKGNFVGRDKYPNVSEIEGFLKN